MENIKLNKNVKVKYRDYVKARLNTIRFTGLFMSILLIGFLIVAYFNLLGTALWNCVSIIYLCGALFTMLAQYQDIRLRTKLAKASRAIAVVFYLLTVSLLVLIILDRFFVIAI